MNILLQHERTVDNTIGKRSKMVMGNIVKYKCVHIRTSIGPGNRANAYTHGWMHPHWKRDAHSYYANHVLHILCPYIVCINSNKQNMRVRSVFWCSLFKCTDNDVQRLRFWNFLLKSFYRQYFFPRQHRLCGPQNLSIVPHRCRTLAIFSYFTRCVCVFLCVYLCSIRRGAVGHWQWTTACCLAVLRPLLCLCE